MTRFLVKKNGVENMTPVLRLYVSRHVLLLMLLLRQFVSG
jgi:hypothetical protein